MFKSLPASTSQDTPTLLYMLYFTAKREPSWLGLLIVSLFLTVFFFFYLIDLLVFSYVFSSGNWKWTAKDFYLASLIIACESAEIRLPFSGCIDQKLIRFLSSTGTFDLIFFITLCDFLEFWIAKGVLPEFCIDIDVFFLRKYFTEVLSAPFYKILLSW